MEFFFSGGEELKELERTDVDHCFISAFTYEICDEKLDNTARSCSSVDSMPLCLLL